MEPPRTPRVLFFADTHFLAHASRALETGLELVRRYGYSVALVGYEPFLRLARQAGMDTEPIAPLQSRAETLGQAGRGFPANPWRWTRQAWQAVRADLEVIDRCRPDLVVSDLRWSLPLAARQRGVPCVSITNAHWTPHFEGPVRTVTDHWTHVFGDLAGEHYAVVRGVLGAYWGAPFTLYAALHGLRPGPSNITQLMAGGDRVLLADVPAFWPLPSAPDHYRYCGPILWQPKQDLPPWFAGLDPERPTLYITMGTSGHLDYFARAIRAFADTDYQVLVTTGGQPLDLGRVPENVYLAEFAPGLPLMERADAVVTHGGSGSLYQAFAARRPVLGIPLHVDQSLNLQRVEELGLGIHLPRRQYSDGALRSGVERLIGDTSYARRLSEFAKSFQTYGGASTAAREIHDFCRERGIAAEPAA